VVVSLKHSTVVAVPDDGTSPVGSDEWNAEHNLTLDSGFVLGRQSAGNGPVEQIAAFGDRPAAGQLTYLSPTALKFAPTGYSGRLIQINGVLYPIPVGGIAGLGNTGVYLDNVANQNLAANTVYTIYAIVVAGVVTANFRDDAPGNHRPSQTVGNESVEVLYQTSTSTEYPTNTLIGMCRTNASAQFQDDKSNKFVLSWFNRRRRTGSNYATANPNTGTGTYAESPTPYRVNFLCWAGDEVEWEIHAATYSGSAVWTYTAIGFDGINAEVTAQAFGTYYYADLLSIRDVKVGLTEGFHYACQLFAGNTTVYFANTAPSNVPSAGGNVPSTHLVITVNG